MKKPKKTKTLATGRKPGSGHHNGPRTGRPPKPETLVRISVQLPPDLKATIQVLAQKDGESMSAVIVGLVRRGLDVTHE